MATYVSVHKNMRSRSETCNFIKKETLEQVFSKEFCEISKNNFYAPNFFCNHLFFCDYFEELQTMLIKVKMIINNTPLTYVCPNTIKTYLTPNHLLLGRQLLYYSNTTSTVVRNLTVLSSTTDKTNHITNHLSNRWRHEYVVNLWETQQASKLNINSPKIMLC